MDSIVQSFSRERKDCLTSGCIYHGAVARAGVGVPEVFHLGEPACRRVGLHQRIPHGGRIVLFTASVLFAHGAYSQQVDSIAQRFGREHKGSFTSGYIHRGAIARTGVGVPEVFHFCEPAYRRVGFYQRVPHGRRIDISILLVVFTNGPYSQQVDTIAQRLGGERKGRLTTCSCYHGAVTHARVGVPEVFKLVLCPRCDTEY